jgi:hypothetical protein
LDASEKIFSSNDIQDISLNREIVAILDRHGRLVVIDSRGEYMRVINDADNFNKAQENNLIINYQTYLSDSGRYLFYTLNHLSSECDGFDCVPTEVSTTELQEYGLENHWSIIDLTNSSNEVYRQAFEKTQISHMEWSENEEFSYLFDESKDPIKFIKFDLSNWVTNGWKTEYNYEYEGRYSNYGFQFDMYTENKGIWRIGESGVWEIMLNNQENRVEKVDKMTETSFASHQFPLNVDDRVLFKQVNEYYNLSEDVMKQYPEETLFWYAKLNTEGDYILEKVENLTSYRVIGYYLWNEESNELTEIDYDIPRMSLK